MSIQDIHRSEKESSGSSKLMIGALGVVYGDIGTSPLYAFKQSIQASGGVSESNVLSILSLIIWSLILVVTIKYVLVIMRANNKGEGGTFAITALALECVKRPTARTIVLGLGLIGAALFYGDCVITPAISVLSAIEGLNEGTSVPQGLIVPITVVLIAALFAADRHGTALIGKFFGPIMILWFAVIALTGSLAIVQNPLILASIDPRLGITFLIKHLDIASVVLGSIVLAVTGGEALFADMGHFGIKPINRVWLWFVFPALLLNYLGQGALVLSDPEAISNPFYRLGPSWALLPMVILAAAATIIASQAVISGAFSITNQAVQLGFIPRVRVRHTSSEEIGQIYVSKVNLLLFLVVEAIVLTFRTSESLGAAYGLAVTGTMAIVTVLACIVMVRKHRWSPVLAYPLFGVFLVIDLIFFATNLEKFWDGGWFPIVVATLLLCVMAGWIHGRNRLLTARWRGAIPLHKFLETIKPDRPMRVPGTAIFMVPGTEVVPLSLLHNMKHNHVLHERVLLMHIKVAAQPFIKDEDRIEITHLSHNFHVVTLHYGFFEEPKITRVLAQLRIQEFRFKLAEVTFFVGNETVTSKSGNWIERAGDGIFIMLHHNMMRAVDYFQIPPGHTIELGGHIEL